METYAYQDTLLSRIIDCDRSWYTAEKQSGCKCDCHLKLNKSMHDCTCPQCFIELIPDNLIKFKKSYLDLLNTCECVNRKTLCKNHQRFIKTKRASH